MKKFLKHIGVIVIAILLMVTIVALYNYEKDVYGVFDKKKEFIGFEPNQRVLKINHATKKNKREKIIFSDSRGGVLNNTNAYSDWYNMSYSMGVAEEFLADLKAIFSTRHNLNEIIIFIDENTLFEQYQLHEKQLLRKIVSLNGIEKYQYLFFIPDFNMLKFIWQNKKQKHNLKFDIYDTGAYIELGYEYSNQKVTCSEQNNSPRKNNIQLFKNKLQVLKDIKKICKENEIKVRFVSHPISTKSYSIDPEKVNVYKQFIEFLNKNNIQVILPLDCLVIEYNQMQWRDPWHYNNVIARKIESKILQ
jgi:hypothetical protein